MQVLADKDRARRQQNIQNSSVSGMGRQSPYSGADGRPPMRPITPIKSSQTTRVHQQTTNSVINTTQQNIEYNNISTGTPHLQEQMNEGPDENGMEPTDELDENG